MRNVVIIFACLLMIGCGPSRYYVSEDHTESRFQLDANQCMAQAKAGQGYYQAGPIRGGGPIGNGIAEGLIEGMVEGQRLSEIYDYCMKGKGYIVVTAEDVKNLESRLRADVELQQKARNGDWDDFNQTERYILQAAKNKIQGRK